MQQRIAVFDTLVLVIWVVHLFGARVLSRRIRHHGRFSTAYVLASAVASAIIVLLLPLIPPGLGFFGMLFVASAGVPLVITAPLVILLTSAAGPREQHTVRDDSSTAVAGDWPPPPIGAATIVPGPPLSADRAGALAETIGIIVSAEVLAAPMLPTLFLQLSMSTWFIPPIATTGYALGVTEIVWQVWTRSISRPDGLMSRRPFWYHVAAIAAATVAANLYCAK